MLIWLLLLGCLGGAVMPSLAQVVTSSPQTQGTIPTVPARMPPSSTTTGFSHLEQYLNGVAGDGAEKSQRRPPPTQLRVLVLTP